MIGEMLKAVGKVGVTFATVYALLTVADEWIRERDDKIESQSVKTKMTFQEMKDYINSKDTKPEEIARRAEREREAEKRRNPQTIRVIY